ncbi:MAG: PDZ domain-containing protein [PVC group bacterium]|nr:PDZ domain-containing protein [PVC group bacterium]
MFVSQLPALSATDLLLQIEQKTSRLAEDVGKAVVSISTERTEIIKEQDRSFGDEYYERFFQDFLYGKIAQRAYKKIGLGSGVIIDSQGHIITNEHIISNADKIIVTLTDGRQFQANIKGSNYATDLAIIKINAPDIHHAKIGNSDSIKPGQLAFALGNPFGFAVEKPEPSINFGIISALNQSLPKIAQSDRVYKKLIQTDAGINIGNSGGPLVNIHGEVIGINVAVYNASRGTNGIGFAIPSNSAKLILDNIIQGEEILYEWLGINIHDLNPALANYFGLSKPRGVLVAGVRPGSPAEKAGFEEKDIIFKFNREKVKNTLEFIDSIKKRKTGAKLKVKVIRRTIIRELNLTIGKRPTGINKNKQKKLSKTSGQLKKQNLNIPEWRGLEVKKEQGGITIVNVRQNSSAETGGLKQGDIINAVDAFEIKTLDDYKKAIDTASGNVLIKTQHGYLVITE